MNNTADTIRKAVDTPPDAPQAALPADCVETIEPPVLQNYFETDKYRPGPAHRPAGPGLLVKI